MDESSDPTEVSQELSGEPLRGVQVGLGLDHRVHVSRREHLFGIRTHAQIGDVILDVRPPVEDTRWDDNHVALVLL